MKKHIKEISILGTIFILLPLLFSIFNLFHIEIHPLIYLISINILAFLTSYYLTKDRKNNSYRLGLLLGISMTIILFLLSIILRAKLSMNMISYYIIIIISTTLASITKKR